MTWRPRRFLLVGTGGLLVIVLLVLAGFWLHFSKEPPDFHAAPGHYRLHMPAASDGRAVTPPANIHVSGTPVLVQFNGIDGSGERPRARLFARVGRLQGHQRLPHRTATLPVGGTMTLQGIVIRVLHVWDEPSATNDAVDVVVTAAN